MSSRDGACATHRGVDDNALLLVTTSDESELLVGDLYALLGSLEHSARVVVVLRDVSDDLARKVAQAPQVLGMVSIPAAGVSTARNAALDWIEVSGIAGPDTIVAFPDDDCRYPAGITATVREAFAAHDCDVLLGSYGPSEAEVNRKRFPASVTRVSGWQELHLVASAGIFLRWRALDGLRFNPALGVGSPLPAAEEIDLILRMLSRGTSVTYDPAVNILHPYHTLADPYARWEAWIALCTGHALANPRFALQGARAWAGWGWRILTRRVSMRYAVGVARRALKPAALNSIRDLAREAASHG